MKLLIFLLFASISITACSAFDVYDKSGNNKLGVPFYLKTGKVKQVTSYTRRWIEAKINYQKLSSGKPIKGTERSAIFAIEHDTYDQVRLLESFAASKSGGEFTAAIISFKNQLKKSCDGRINCEISPRMIIEQSSSKREKSDILSQKMESNISSYKVIVDYENPYYFNANIPLFGTATATAELATDGTLTKATSTVDSTKLADSIPLKELLLDKWGLVAEFSPENTTGGLNDLPPATQRNHLITISISTNGYKYSITKYYPYSSGLNLIPLEFCDKKTSISKTNFSSIPKKKEDKKNNAIRFDGSIVLPESKE